jgi:hypothetical protein
MGTKSTDAFKECLLVPFYGRSPTMIAASSMRKMRASLTKALAFFFFVEFVEAYSHGLVSLRRAG